MPSLIELSQAVEAYRSGHISIDQFEDWYRDHSVGMFGEAEDVVEAYLAVEQAFSIIRFDDATEDEFGEALSAAIRPVAQEDRSPFHGEVVAHSG